MHARWEELRLTHARLPELFPAVESAAERMAVSVEGGGKILVCGNGGSAADAIHFATELVSRFLMERRAVGAIPLTANVSALTAIANDYRFEDVFARQVEAYGRKGDVLVGISTSGRSENILQAFKKGRELDLFNIALLGSHVESCRGLVDQIMSVPSDITARVQECHIFLIHLISELLEERLFGKVNLK
ncbi:MAG: D-sedoheptulose-7-phosphate isomerase [Desulfocucumaceae bacterium]